jgi:hypothetical protein
MRSDMKKVVTERPRGGGRGKTPKGERKVWQDCAPEDYPKREKIRVKWGDGKWFTDVLGPLYRYLLKQVGRPWNAVYSEICANLPKTSMQNRHVYTHIWQFVEKDVKIVDGVACFGQGYWRDTPIISIGRYAQLYIHPGHGLLCKARKHKSYKHRRREQPAPWSPGIKVYPGVQYHKLGNVWYEVKVRRYVLEPDQLQRVTYAMQVTDEVLGRTYESPAQAKFIYGGNYLAVSKRPLNGREIKFAGLK